jgi:UTP:GlnB (protein PII) uridylyltransferase
VRLTCGVPNPLTFPSFRSRTTTRRRARATLSELHQREVDGQIAAALRHVPTDVETRARVADAPPAYLLVHGSGDIARHCQLLSPLPVAGEVRVVVTPGRAQGQWNIDVASRDRPGLLAAFTGVLAARYLDVVQAVVATWDDGAALDTFVVRSATPPDAAALQAGFEAGLGVPFESTPLLDAVVTFDGNVSPMFTRCDVRASDRVGLLHSIVVAFAAAGADVHAASMSTKDGVAFDRFDLSATGGGKLHALLEEQIDHNVRNGVTTVEAGMGAGRRSRRSRVA